MTDVTALGAGLVYADQLRTVEGFKVVDRFGAKTSSSLHAKPNTGHPALALILPTCNEAVAALGATGKFDGLLVLCMLYQENRTFTARSSTVAGTSTLIARGLGQFLYGTGALTLKPRIEDFYNPGDAIYATVRYLLDYCLKSATEKGKTLPKSTILGYAVMMYNAGPGYKRLATYDSPTIKNKVDGKVTGIPCKKYAREINEHYKKFSGSSTGPLTFV